MASPVRVILGMSGGVDSSVAASILVEQGYEVHGVTLQVWEQEDDTAAVSKRWQERGCCKVGLARFVAQRLGIVHEVIDTRSIFRSQVIDDFLAGYLEGTTPNPCVRCNERVKLRMLMQVAEERGADCIATGHYARIERQDGRWDLCRAADSRKDQTYFLYRLHESWLPKLLFPVGHLEKAEVWDRAAALALPVDELKESQEICFVSQGDYRSFLLEERPESRQSGLIKDIDGQILGQHEGIAFYTPGQRKGLGVAAGQRLYVQRVEPRSQTVIVGQEDGLYRTDCLVSDLNLLDESLRHETRQVSAKIRYATPAATGTVEPVGDGALRLIFEKPQRALSPGQSAVFYDRDRVLGGGIIQPT